MAQTQSEQNNLFNPNALLGNIFPINQLKTISNKILSINQLRGKPTLINFWFTTCMPCIAEIPVLNNIKKTMSDSINFIAITHEKKTVVKTFLQKKQYSFIQITDNNYFIDSLYMKTFPVNIFLDKNGIIRKIEGGIPYFINANNEIALGDGKEFIAMLRKLLLE